MITLVPVKDLRAADEDPATSALARIGLAKLGFVLPVYADAEGVVLWGRELFAAAVASGLVEVPVARLESAADAVLVDAAVDEVVRPPAPDEELVERLLDALVAVPDRDRGAFFRCLEATPERVRDLLPRVRLPYDRGRVDACRRLLRRAVPLPVIVDEAGRVVNGHYRVIAAYEENLRELPRIVVRESEAPLVKMILDATAARSVLLARRKRAVRLSALRAERDTGLSPGLKLLVPEGPRFWVRFREVYGESILDLACGSGANAPLLRAQGIAWTGWDPFPRRDGRIAPELEREWATAFVRELESGTEWSTVLLDRVLHELPYHEDRWALLVLAHACCSVPSLCVGTAEHAARYVQQLHGLFASVELVGRRGFVARWPRRVDWSALVKALHHELSLPAPDDPDRRALLARLENAFRNRLLDKGRLHV